MLVHCRVTPSIEFAGTHLIHLGGERYRESKVSCPRTQHNVPQPGLKPGLLAPELSVLTLRPPCLPHGTTTLSQFFLHDIMSLMLRGLLYSWKQKDVYCLLPCKLVCKYYHLMNINFWEFFIFIPTEVNWEIRKARCLRFCLLRWGRYPTCRLQ